MTTAAETGEWLIGINAWVIQDGNYGDFTVGERRRFALECYTDTWQGEATGPPTAIAVGDAEYDIRAEVVLNEKGLLVLDFGLLTYTELHPHELAEPWRSARIHLAVDPFPYFESHGLRQDVPPAVYTWTITGIWRQTAPFVPNRRFRPHYYVRDPKHLGWAPLERTEAWRDDDGSADYLLRCRLEDDAPVRHP